MSLRFCAMASYTHIPPDRHSMKKSLLITFLPVLFFYSCHNTTNPAPPLVDGSCQEYEGLEAQIIALDYGVKLHMYQDDHYVWFCYCYADGSFGTLDMEVESPNLDGPLNLHVSAQLGEWPINQPELAPKNSQSDKWWNHKGWTANEVWMNGLNRTEERTSPRWKNAPARELQLSKTRFGRGDWKIKMQINSVKKPDEGLASITFPADADTYTLKVY